MNTVKVLIEGYAKVNPDGTWDATSTTTLITTPSWPLSNSPALTLYKSPITSFPATGRCLKLKILLDKTNINVYYRDIQSICPNNLRETLNSIGTKEI